MSVTFEQAAAAVREVEALTGEKLVDARRAVNALRGGASPSRNVTGRSKSRTLNMQMRKNVTDRSKSRKKRMMRNVTKRSKTRTKNSRRNKN